MIVDFFLEVGIGILGWILDLMVMPGGGIDFVAQASAVTASVFVNIGGLSVWIPWGVITGTVTLIFGLWLTFVGLKFITWLKNLMGMGGS